MTDVRAARPAAGGTGVAEPAGLAGDLAAAALALARRFAAGATLWCVSPEWPSHARHVAVEFVHPVIVGKRALPAVAVDDADPVGTLRLLARPGDVVLVVATAAEAPSAAIVRRADAWGLTSIRIGAGGDAPDDAPYVLWLDGVDVDHAAFAGGFVGLHHVLWELTHVVFEHPGLLREPAAGGDDAGCDGDVCITCSDEGRVAEVSVVLDLDRAVVRAGGREETIATGLVDAFGSRRPRPRPRRHRADRPRAGSVVTGEPTSFLYPFIDEEERGAGSLLTDLAASARGKFAESRRLADATLADAADVLSGAAGAMAGRFARGGRLFTFGNGGSAADADSTAELFRRGGAHRGLPAASLVEDRGVLTALANDVGFELVFSRQLIAHARPDDVALGFSTSGDSVNVLRAFAEARRRGLATVGLCGHGGGAMAASDDVEHCVVVRSDSVHRVQETQQALVFELFELVHAHLERGMSR